MFHSNRRTATASSRSRGRGRRGVTGATEVFHRQGPGRFRRFFCLLIRLRAELFTFTVLFTAWLYLCLRYSPFVSYVVPCGILAVTLAVPHSRRYVIRRCWAVLARHRLRSCLVQIRTMNYDGLLPLMLWSRPTAIGERIWLWMRPGISIDDLSGRTEHLAVACWARDARVERSRRMAALVRVDIVRRDPLTGRKSRIDSPLTLIGAGGPTPPPVDLTAPGKKLRVVRDRTPDVKPTSRTTTRKTTTPRSDTPGLVVNGEDISDYVD